VVEEDELEEPPDDELDPPDDEDEPDEPDEEEVEEPDEPDEDEPDELDEPEREEEELELMAEICAEMAEICAEMAEICAAIELREDELEEPDLPDDEDELEEPDLPDEPAAAEGAFIAMRKVLSKIATTKSTANLARPGAEIRQFPGMFLPSYRFIICNKSHKCFFCKNNCF